MRRGAFVVFLAGLLLLPAAGAARPASSLTFAEARHQMNVHLDNRVRRRGNEEIHRAIHHCARRSRVRIRCRFYQEDERSSDGFNIPCRGRLEVLETGTRHSVREVGVHCDQPYL